MRRLGAITLAALSLGGCVERNINEGLAALVGQPIQAAVAHLGYPSSQRNMLGDTIYVWASSQDVNLPVPVTSTTTGTIAGTPVYATTTSTAYEPANFNCSVQIATDAKGIIKSYQWSGNYGGCYSYGQALHH